MNYLRSLFEQSEEEKKEKERNKQEWKKQEEKRRNQWIAEFRIDDVNSASYDKVKYYVHEKLQSLIDDDDDECEFDVGIFKPIYVHVGVCGEEYFILLSIFNQIVDSFLKARRIVYVRFSKRDVLHVAKVHGLAPPVLSEYARFKYKTEIETE